MRIIVLILQQRYLSLLKIAILGTLVPLAGCTLPAPLACQPGEQAQIHDLIYFGTDKPDGRVTDAQWAEFLAGVVTPHFPAGLTVLSGQGQWRDDTGEIIREDSHVLSLVHRQEPSVGPAIEEITTTYKRRFQQESVLRVRSAVCVSFR
ncbi:DUF3574 domain-containing protein [Microbulbifer sp. ARAS458-1]|uniref:DUF3574 domain-containing protein n=1 Tax=Microbulbifer sp. ARAS458-1 TaxID=3140242 RepID=UPI0038780372